MMKIKNLTKEVESLLSNLRKKHSSIVTMRLFLKEDKNIVQVANHLELNLSGSSLSRAKNWAKIGINNIDDKFKRDNAIGEKKLKEMISTLKILLELSSGELNDIILNLGKLSGPNLSSNKPIIGLRSFIGSYRSYHPDLSMIDNHQILEGNLELSSDTINARSLKAVYTSGSGFNYKGKCEQKGETLYISVRDDREWIYMIARVGLKVEGKRPIINAVSCCINNIGNPVSFNRILIREEYAEKYKEEIRQYITRTHGLSETPLLTINQLKRKNTESEIPKVLKKLSGKKYISYNHFAFPSRKELFKNTWEFSEQGGKLFVKRKGVYGRSYLGEAFIIKNHLCVSFTNIKDEKDRRLYFARLLDTDAKSRDYKSICFIGIGINVVSSSIAGRELLIRYKNDSEMSFEPDGINPNEIYNTNPELYSKIFSHIGGEENAVFHLKENTKPLDKKIQGHYFLYYISSANNQLMRNRAILKHEYGRNYFHYETDECTYSLINMYFREPYIICRLKDHRQNLYFTFHMEVGKSEKQHTEYTEIITGSSSAISFNRHMPVASGVLLMRISPDVYEEASLGWQNPDNLSEDELKIKDYLFLCASNPMVFRSIRNMEQLKKALGGVHKKRFLKFYSNQITHHIHEGLKPTHTPFIEDLLKIIGGFTTENSVEFRTDYVELFRIFYHEVLKYYRGTQNTFYATSYPKEQFFWYGKNQAEDLIRQYVQDGGKMYRIFFLDSKELIPDQSELEILKRHFYIYGFSDKFGGLYIASTNNVDSVHVFSTESNRFISWDVYCDWNRSIERLQIFTDKVKHFELRAYFKKVITNNKISVKVTEKHIQKWEELYQ